MSHLSHLVSESVMMIVMTMITYGVSDSGSVMMSPCSSACVSPVSSMGQGNGSFPWVTLMATGWGHCLACLTSLSPPVLAAEQSSYSGLVSAALPYTD